MSELAWAAGLFDGEGSTIKWIPDKHRPYAYARVQVPQKTRLVLDRFRTAVGIGKVYGPYSGGFLFTATNTDAGEVLTKIGSFLSPEKTEQALLVLKEVNARSIF